MAQAGVEKGTDDRAVWGLLGSLAAAASAVSGSLIPTNSVPPPDRARLDRADAETWTSFALAVPSIVPEFQTSWPLLRS